MKKKTYNKKEDFLLLLSSMTNNELNDFIKNHGSKPKKIPMCYLLDKNKNIINLDGNNQKI